MSKTNSNKIDAKSWEFTQRIIRIGHNRKVKQFFKDINSDTSFANGRAVLKTALLIRDNDSAIETLNKQIYFNNIYQELVTSYPDGWQIRKGQDIPQLAIIFRPVDKDNKSGNYTLHIPHYNGSKNPKVDSYYKGDYWARWILKDNSQIVVNAKTKAEALKTIKKLEKQVISKFQTPELPWLTTGKVTKGTYKEIQVKPIRADYYPKGKAESIPLWRHYF